VNLRNPQDRGTVWCANGVAVEPHANPGCHVSCSIRSGDASNRRRAKGSAGVFGDALGKVVQGGHPLGNVLGFLTGVGGRPGEEAKGAAAKFDLEAAAVERLVIEIPPVEKAQGKLSDETKKAAAEAEKYKQKIETMARRSPRPTT
jgi:hypothetical protein